MAENEQTIGTARVDVVVDTSSFDAAITSAKNRTAGMSQAAQQAYAQLNAAEKRRVDSLIKQADTINYTREQQILYNATLKGTPTVILDELKAKLSGVTAASDKYTMSAKAQAAALRGVPAQITDIVTGLATGQRPITVLLQQGGQLKDMFGGIGPAAKALGTSLLGLINPVTIAASAAAALLLAWKSGADEADAYNKALINTGGYAGVTAGRLSDMAEAISDTVGTQHQAAAALATVAASGQFTSQQLLLVGRAAVEMEQLTGQSADATVKQFEKLKDDPVKAVLALNDAQHFLTESAYEQIKALQDQGRTQDAATLAMQTYSKALDDRRAEVVSNAGLMERAWSAVTGAAKGAWDAMLNVGRQGSIGDQVSALQEMKKRLQDTSFFSFTDLSPADRQKRIDAIDKQISDLYLKAGEESRKASDKAASAQLVQDRADSDRQASQYATNAQKRAAAYLAAEKEFNDRIARAEKAGNTDLANQERRQKGVVLAGINEQYKDKAVKEGPGDPADMVQIRKEITDAIEKQYAADAKEMSQEAKSQLQAKAYAETLRDMLDTRKQAIDLQVESIGMGKREADQQRALIAIDEDYNRKKADLQKRQQDTSSALEKEGYQQQLDDLAKYHEDRIKAEVDGFKREDAARRDASLGAKAALQDFIDAGSDAAGQSYGLFSNAFDGMADSLADFVTTGKLHFADLAQSILSDLAKMEIRILASQALQAIFGGYDATGGAGQATYNSMGGVTHVDFGGGRARGGPVAGGSLYEVAEGGKPELLQAGGRTYLMMGSQGGNVTPAASTAGMKASGASGPMELKVTLKNESGQPLQAKQSGQPAFDGQAMMAEFIISTVASDTARGGKTAAAQQQRWGLTRRGVGVGG